MRHAAGRYCYNSEYNPGIFQIKFQGWRSYVFLRQKGSRNMWYVIQTVTGKEEELMLFIRNILCRERYESCFVIYAQWMKRLGGEWQIQVRPLFPGYVFIDTEEPERLYMDLKAVPKFSRLLGTGTDEFVPVKKEEEKFLRMITGGSGEMADEPAIERMERADDATVKLTVVETELDGGIRSMEGALSCFASDDVRLNLHKRYAVVNTRMLGEERTLGFGIRLKKDR